jgi:hypothetical protein
MNIHQSRFQIIFCAQLLGITEVIIVRKQSIDEVSNMLDCKLIAS